MPGAFKRKSDKARGRAGKWTVWYVNEKGVRTQRAMFTDKAKSEKYARDMEELCRGIRDGLIDPKERDRRQAASQPIGEHIDAYAASLAAKEDTPKHVAEVKRILSQLLIDAGISSLAEFDVAKIQQALTRLRAKRSARTSNKALGFVKAFAFWLSESNRLGEYPRGLKSLPRFNEATDKRYERRSITRAELARLLTATEVGDPVVFRRGTLRGPRKREYVTGPERAALYRLAMGTGFRAEELRTLTPERFRLDGDEPTVTVLACYSKNGKEAVQPITPELAAELRPFVEGKPAGLPFLKVPRRTALMLQRDLAAVGIPAKTADGVLDFHALRASYITHLIESGANPKVVQVLARHSTVMLTVGLYLKTTDEGSRQALGRKTG